jgi:hypothetical protein
MICMTVDLCQVVMRPKDKEIGRQMMDNEIMNNIDVSYRCVFNCQRVM